MASASVAGAIAWVGLPARHGGPAAGRLRGRTTAELAEALRERKGVLLVPGEHFGMPQSSGGYLRIGFGYAAGQLQQALARVDDLLAEPLG